MSASATPETELSPGARAEQRREGHPQGEEGHPQRKLTRLLFAGTIGIAILVLVASWVYDDLTAGDGADRIFAVGASFAASAFWWMLLAHYAEREIRAFAQLELKKERRIALETLDEQLALARDSWAEGVQSLQDELEAARRSRENADVMLKTELRKLVIATNGVPAAVYAGRKDIDLRYNKDLTNHLEASRTYEFHGPTGIYVGARLLVSRSGDTPVESVRVRISDPRSATALRHAVAARMKRNGGDDEAIVEAAVREDLYLSLVGLFVACKQTNNQIEIVFDDRGVGERIERFTDAVYVASVSTGETTLFTYTLRWDQRAQAAQFADQAANCDAIWRHVVEVSEESVTRLDRRTTEAEFRRRLRDLGFDEERFGDVKKHYLEQHVTHHSQTIKRAANFSEGTEYHRPCRIHPPLS